MSLAVQFHDLHPTPASTSLRDEILTGFRADQKFASPKFFYDQRGSELFDQICEQPEYYPTRTEEAILAEAADDIAEIAGHEATLIELGSGASRKVRLLLEAMRPSSYLGIDISRDFLLDSTRRLAADYPWLEVHAACADFCCNMALPDGLCCERPVGFFPGSSIGNFDPQAAEDFLCGLHSLLPTGSGLLVGVDLVKDKPTLEAAYNDAAGVTAAFNLNLLERLRHELHAKIDPANFVHQAFFNEAHSRIEMHLVSQLSQVVTIEGERFSFLEGETIHTENSYKYTVEGFQALAGRAGFEALSSWTDANSLFSVHYLTRA
ncbi:L-histidine N(alpha)-methyltransferase [Halomonas sp. FeN2]|uniref:L-histidine N(Alpha)-methyltransferase n=1 Tax=Vreelandella aquamarina TaxID=77097 RepID=A0A857GH45_9GAMM|nr:MULTISPECIES: L-histidine N(alpha)-methyltransferase [Halomonas]QHD48598.1 L-histidine N(alpha)-methyltransferase [Halomonas meridiana]UBR48416.1 L-histidine N(alpha)-methyltransferase [Halomonas sp. FeN2]